MNDRSGAFDYIIPGDSIRKSRDSLKLIVVRDGDTTEYRLNYGCLK
jgi:hypothetical protein